MQAKIFSDFAGKVISQIEANHQGITFWLGLLFFLCIVKAVVGWFASRLMHLAPPFMFLVHWPLFYFNIFISIALILRFFTGEKLQNTTKVVFAFSFLVLIIPIIDFFAYGINVSRIYPMSIDELLAEFFSFCGLLPGSVLTVGQGITFWSAEILIAIYVLTKTKSLRKALGASISFYFVGAFFSAIPFFAASIFSIGSTYTHAAMLIGTAFFLVLAFLLSAVWLFVYDKELLKKLIADVMLTRAMHYLGLALMGWLFAVFLFPAETMNLFGLFIALFSVFCAFESCLICNKIYDNALKKAEVKKYWDLCLALLCFSLVSAYLASEIFFVIVLISLVFGLLYSLPPVRLKRVGFMNNAVIGLISALTFYSGFLVQAPSIEKIPLNLIATVFLTFSLAANVKDLKDYEQDKKEGIKTLPVLLGRERGLKVAALLTSVSFLIPPFILGFNRILVIAAVFGTANYLLLRKIKEEKVTFLLYYAFLVLFAAAMLAGFA